MTPSPTPAVLAASPDWEIDYYSRPILEPDGKKRWELLICSTPAPDTATADGASEPFRWVRACPATSVNSTWLRQAIQDALDAAAERNLGTPRRLRCWRGSMRTMVQRAAEGLGLELIPSRRCYAMVEWLKERQNEVYPLEPGYLAGPLAPPPDPIRPVPLPLPEVARGERWNWASLPAATLAEAGSWEIGFAGLSTMPPFMDPQIEVPGIRLFSSSRALAVAGWLAGLEPVRLEVFEGQLVLEAGLEDRWRLASLPFEEARAATEAFSNSRERAGGLQFLAVQQREDQPRFEGFWMMRDLPDG